MKRNILTCCLLFLLAMPMAAQKDGTPQRRLLKKARSSREYAALGQKSLADGYIDEAKDYWKLAKREKRISVDEICLGGDIYRKEDKDNLAERQYRRAIYFNPRDAMGYDRLVTLYTDLKQPAKAVGILDTLGAMRPDLDVKSRIAGIYYDAGDNDNAVKVFGQMSLDSLNRSQLARYGSAELLLKHYDQALRIGEYGHGKFPRAAVFNRLRAAANDNLHHYENALQASEDFFYQSDSLAGEVMPNDYIWYGLALNGTGRTKEAIDQFEKALRMSPDDPGVTETIANAYLSIRQYEKAAEYYSRYIALKDDKINLYYDTYRLGNIYWQEAIDSTVSQDQQTAALKKADTYYKQLTELRPDDYHGYYYRARVYSLLDPESDAGLAKPHFEKVIELIRENGGDEGTLAEAYKWMAYYYYHNKNMARAHQYAGEALQVAPNDTYAKQIYDVTN